jgi:hypothetical protein
MAERLNAPVLKTGIPKGIGGSNPSFSARTLFEEAGSFFLPKILIEIEELRDENPRFEPE